MSPRGSAGLPWKQMIEALDGEDVVQGLKLVQFVLLPNNKICAHTMYADWSTLEKLEAAFCARALCAAL